MVRLISISTKYYDYCLFPIQQLVYNVMQNQRIVVQHLGCKM